MFNISLVLSGGVLNKNPNNSLGGYPSPTLLSNGVIDNLFPTIDIKNISTGKTDYRCIYFFNDNDVTLYNLNIKTRMESLETYSMVNLGFNLLNEIQAIRIVPFGTPVGTFKLKLDSLETNEITYDNDIEILSQSIENELKSILDNDVSVSYYEYESEKNFTITFNGRNKNKYFSLIQVINIVFTNPDPVPEFYVTKVQSGSPINTIADSILSDNITPNNITFSLTGSSGITVGSLKPNEGFPIWIKRIIKENSPELLKDGFRFAFRLRNGYNDL